jgi:hypothetical protein
MAYSSPLESRRLIMAKKVSTNEAKNESKNVAYIAVITDIKSVNNVRDLLRAKLKGAHIRRVMGPESDQTLMIALQPPGDFTEALRNALTTIENAPGVIRSRTYIGTLLFSAKEIPRDRPVGWLFLSDSSPEGFGCTQLLTAVVPKLQDTTGVVQIAQIVGDSLKAVVYEFDPFDVSSLVDLTSNVRATFAGGGCPAMHHGNYTCP